MTNQAAVDGARFDLATALTAYERALPGVGYAEVGRIEQAARRLLSALAHVAPRVGVLGDVAAERARQDAKWGEQNHPDGTGPDTHPLVLAGADNPSLFPGPFRVSVASLLADAFTRSTDARAQEGSVTWRDILLEEVFEALAESDPARLRTELVQVAAVATQWVEAIDRRGHAG